MNINRLYATVAKVFLAVSFIATISCGTRAQGNSTLQSGTKWAIVNVSDAFMRDEPRYGSECVSQTRMGTLVQVLERKGYWVRVKTPEPYEGWINELALAPTRELSPEEQKAEKRYGAVLEPMTQKEAQKYLKADKYIVLRGTSVEKDLLFYGADNVVTNVQMGNILRAKPSKDANVANVILPDGKEGFVGGNCVRDFREWAEEEAAEPDGKKAEDIVALARSFLGCPYLWAGMSPGHFDCSGLTGFCYFMNGILLPRDASQQVKCGVEVPFEQMQAGDLVFFGSRSSIREIGHVGIIVDVDLNHGMFRFIHASSSNGVEIQRSTQPYFMMRYIGAGRILPD